MDTKEYSQRMYDLLLKEKLKPEAAAGVIGNARHETGNFKVFSGDKGTSGGAFHFHGPRLRGLQDYALAQNLDMNSPEAGVGYLMKEIADGKHVPKNLIEMLNAAPDVDTAARIFSEKAERPGIPHIDNRMGLARDTVNLLGGGGSGVVQAPPATVQEKPFVPDPNIALPPAPTGIQQEVTPWPVPPLEHKVSDLLSGKGFKDLTLSDVFNLRKQIAKAPGYGDMSHFKAGMSGANNAYQDISQFAQPSLQSLMQMIMQGAK
jgi:hypothetical protein